MLSLGFFPTLDSYLMTCQSLVPWIILVEHNGLHKGVHYGHPYVAHYVLAAYSLYHIGLFLLFEPELGPKQTADTNLISPIALQFWFHFYGNPN